MTAVDGDPADDLAFEAHRPRNSLRGTQVLEQCQPVMTVSGYPYASGPTGGGGPATHENSAQVNAIQFRATMDTLQ
jgi:hypothetical protein